MQPEGIGRPTYQSFLVRFWREGTPQYWRGSVQSTVTEQTYYFADIQLLLAFLKAHVEIHDGHDGE